MTDVDILQEVTKIRDYQLDNIFLCHTCFLAEDRMFSFVTIFIKNGVNQKCTNGHITRPYRKCTRCNSNYKFGEDTCPTCEGRLYRIVKLRVKIDILNEEMQQTRREMRNGFLNEEEGEIRVIRLQTEIHDSSRLLDEAINEEPKKEN